MKKTIAMIAAMTLSISAMFSTNAFALDGEVEPAIVEVDSLEEIDTDSAYNNLNTNQQKAYDEIKKACDAFMNSDVNLSTNAFKIVHLPSVCIL